MSGLQDIWQNNDPHGLSQEKLMAYLEGKLSDEERHEVEAWLANEGMEADALEGLMDIPAEETQESVNRLNFQLRQQLIQKRERRKRYIRETPWSWVAIGVILILAALAFWIIHLSLKHKT
ncbi:zf-HC2 domain-containing protein [Taibaiella soli]|uniref:Anti-sigma factor n=1 Tax=Taibaiella soli TaxID=1649169 RepID=A0A2W2AN18_9BACT|nr:hypothetical protein [Taibaiella soli]PZF74952.1 hypothetical protein DN068_01775 [Taibaiella soli]